MGDNLYRQTDRQTDRQTRDLSLDFIRGIAIILVVLGHCIQYGSGSTYLTNSSYYDDILFKVIYSFHMPLFALLSGYLFYWSMKRDAFALVKRQVLSLLVPIVSWKAVEFVILGFVRIFNGEFSFLSWAIEGTRSLLTLWFLLAIFFCSMVVLIIERLMRGRVWIYIVFLILTLFLPDKANSYLVFFLYPFFVAGFVFHKETSSESSRVSSMQGTHNGNPWIEYIVVLACMVVFSVALLIYNHDCYIYTTKISILDAENAITQVGIDIFRWAIGFVGTILVVMLCVLVYKTFHEKKFFSAVIRAVVRLGQMSIGIYILNYYTNSYLLPYITKNASPNFALWILEVTISLLLYSAVVYCIRKIPLLNRLFLGGR